MTIRCWSARNPCLLAFLALRNCLAIIENDSHQDWMGPKPVILGIVDRLTGGDYHLRRREICAAGFKNLMKKQCLIVGNIGNMMRHDVVFPYEEACPFSSSVCQRSPAHSEKVTPFLHYWHQKHSISQVRPVPSSPVSTKPGDQTHIKFRRLKMSSKEAASGAFICTSTTDRQVCRVCAYFALLQALTTLAVLQVSLIIVKTGQTASGANNSNIQKDSKYPRVSYQYHWTGERKRYGWSPSLEHAWQVLPITAVPCL